MYKFLTSTILFGLSVLTLKAGDPDSLSFTNNTFDSRIKSVQLYKEGWNLSYPVIKLNSDEKLVLEFDLLDNVPETYYYTLIHCSKDWKRSDIFTTDYLDGIPDNPIEDYSPSFNTTVNYTHYKLVLPNDRIQIKISGNYLLFVYNYSIPDKPVLTQRFIVTEEAAGIDIKTHRPQLTVDDNAGQQVDFKVNIKSAGIIDPDRNIYAFILQNGRWDNAKRNLKPDVSGNNELIYNSLSNKNIFMGGNEYRYFDIKSIKYQSEFIKKIDFIAPYYNVYLYPSENREFKPYFYWKDFNGKYYIASQEGQNPETDANYIYVYFTLPSKYMLTGGRMFVSGGLNNWSFNGNNLMIYNQEKGQYECIILLKQGWYNYEYVFLKNGTTDGTASKFEGSHYETENDYQVIIYYRNPRDRFDRVIGTALTNTLNRLAY
jgi:hypothetical protein